jgi:hypothetical protein
MPRALPSRRRAPSNRRRALAAVLAMALVLVQMLGLAHRIVHVERALPATAGAFAAGADGSAALKRPAPRSDGSGWLALFALHDPGADCDAFDQMSHADLVVDISLDEALPCSGSQASSRHAAWHVAAQARGFLARGPPSAA